MTDSTKRKVRPSQHCFEDYYNQDTGESFTCLLENEHEGNHEWTNDNEIVVEFSKWHLQQTVTWGILELNSRNKTNG